MAPGRRRPVRYGSRRVDDAGGVWILTGVLLGVLVYAGVVVMYIAGFTPVAPLVVIPPVLIGLIGANSLLGGGRGHARSSAGPAAATPTQRRSPAPVDPDGPGAEVPSRSTTAPEEPRKPS